VFREWLFASQLEKTIQRWSQFQILIGDLL